MSIEIEWIAFVFVVSVMIHLDIERQRALIRHRLLSEDWTSFYGRHRTAFLALHGLVVGIYIFALIPIQNDESLIYLAVWKCPIQTIGLIFCFWFWTTLTKSLASAAGRANQTPQSAGEPGTRPME